MSLTRIEQEHAEDVDDDDDLYMKTEPTIYGQGQTRPNRAYSLRRLTHRGRHPSAGLYLRPRSTSFGRVVPCSTNSRFHRGKKLSSGPRRQSEALRIIKNWVEIKRAH